MVFSLQSADLELPTEDFFQDQHTETKHYRIL